MTLKEDNIAIGSIFRLITPILIAVLGSISIMYLKSISLKFDKIDAKFDNFTEKYGIVDKRLDRLEYRIFNEGNVNHQ